jgi:serine protease Do
VDASTIDKNCTGYVNESPTLSVDWSGSAELIRVFYVSDHDPMLVIQLPSGEYVCNDNAHRLLLDPVIAMEKPEAGNYRIWVGAADEGQLVPGVLVITARKDVTLGNFVLGNLVKRGVVADTLEEPAATDERKAMAEKLLKGVIALKAAHDTGRIQTFSRDVEAAGEMEAHELPIGDAFCNGYISEQPSLVFDVPENEKDLIIYFEGNGDSTLVLAKPDGTFLCNDDHERDANVNPLIFIEDPQPGQYAVWVGRVSTDAPVNGKLTVTELARRPARLAPKPAPTAAP